LKRFIDDNERKFVSTINKTDKNGITPLMASAWIGNSTISNILMNHNANVFAVDHDKRNALMHAIIFR
jgi:ankyrin repeat protein